MFVLLIKVIARNLSPACRHFAFAFTIASSRHTQRTDASLGLSVLIHHVPFHYFNTWLPSYHSPWISTEETQGQNTAPAFPPGFLPPRKAWGCFRKLIFTHNSRALFLKKAEIAAHVISTNLLEQHTVFSPEDWTRQITQKMEADGYVSFLFVSSSLFPEWTFLT